MEKKEINNITRRIFYYTDAIAFADRFNTEPLFATYGITWHVILACG